MNKNILQQYRRHQKLWMLTAGVCLVGCTSSAQTSNELYLVRDKEAKSVIVAAAQPAPPVKLAIDELQYHLHRATGVTLKVVDEQNAAALPADTVRIVIDNGALAKKHGVDIAAAPLDTYRVVSRGNTLVFAGHDSLALRSGNYPGGAWNAATQWAVDYYLDKYWGVRWLWPGDVGTHVPLQANIPLPAIDYTGRPEYETRLLDTRYFEPNSRYRPRFLSAAQDKAIFEDAYTWLRRFQMGNRSDNRYAHAFTKWWAQYSKTHPEYFAQPPAGVRQLGPRAVKLNVGNEAVDDAIIAEWKAAGSPDNWNVCPNDGVGFDTSDASRAMDDPPGQDPTLIFTTANANLTARYVKFWNRLIAKMRQTNPRITLSTYAYSAYRQPPINGLKVDPGIIFYTVPTYWWEKEWQGWSDAGAKAFYLRPNWWHSGGPAPVIPLHHQANFVKFAQQHGMDGFKYDSLHGNWATMGSLYYLNARLLMRPEMSVDDVIDEYCSAFDNGAPAIKKYLAYWEELSDKAAYSVAAGGEALPPETGLYHKILKENGLPTHPIFGSWYIMPLLFTDATVQPAADLLDEADQLNADTDTYVKARIQFLRDGLAHMKLTRDVLQLGYIKKRTPAQEAQFRKLADELRKMRSEMSPRHVVWGENLSNYEEKRRKHLPTYPEDAREDVGDLEGM